MDYNSLASIIMFLKGHYKRIVFIWRLHNGGGITSGILQKSTGNYHWQKIFSESDGIYSQANKLDQVSSYSIPQVIVHVIYPVYSSLQDDKNKLIDIISMNIRVISFLVSPLMGLLILIAEPLIVWLYGDKRLPSVPYFQILCVGGYFVCLQNINFYAVAVIGMSKTLFYWSFYKWGVLLAALIIGMNFGMYGILWGMVLNSINIYIVNASLVSKYVGLPMTTQLIYLLPILIGTIISLGISQYAKSENMNVLLLIIIDFSTYISLCLICRLHVIIDTCNILHRLIKSEK